MLIEDQSLPKLYKFKELKVYASTEWLANNKKKYRQVFDRYQTSYIYAELSFFNKSFDSESWDVDVNLKCFELNKEPKEICNLEFTKKVSKYENIVSIREGWGNKRNGVFWKKGVYYWEAWLDGEKLATKYFYVEDVGENKSEENLYFKIDSISLFEGQYDAPSDSDKVYYKEFAADQTKYIYADINVENLIPSGTWHLELFAKFYNEARELKGQVTKLVKVRDSEKMIQITPGWGSNSPGSWRKGSYTMELIFLDQLIAVSKFEIGDHFEEGEIELRVPNSASEEAVVFDANSNLNFDELMAKMDAMIGLKDIKEKVREHAMYLKFLKLRKEKGIEKGSIEDIHSVFIGNPGTGKTTVAKMLGLLYKKMGLLSKGHVLEVDRVDLVGEYIGQTAPKVKEIIKKARGGVLFIDEAYSLARTNDDSKDFGREVVEILVKEMSNGKGDLSVIVAGYPKEMKHFIDSNPGLKSRFKQFFEFKDYLPQELARIADFACEAKGVTLDLAAKNLLNQMITEAFRNRDKSFGNARYIFDLIEKAKINLGLRIMSLENPTELSEEILSHITINDIEQIDLKKVSENPQIPIDQKLLTEAMSELESLIGIKHIKNQINELIRVIQYHHQTGKDVLNNYFLHTVLIGNPGTGKTTVARILAKIYKALGLLERGHMIETDRQGLISGFVGQTAIKTAEKIDEAMGGVLFVDEAYALSNYGGMQGDYGNEAIQTILKRMEDSRGQFFVFAAGYPSNMETFLKANPGLSSRFDKILKFDDYAQDELYEIALKMVADLKYAMSKESKELLFTMLAEMHLKRDKYFGNARDVRKMVLEVIKQQNLRIAQQNAQGEVVQEESIIQAIDLKSLNLKEAEDIFTKSKIGFGKR